MTMPTEIVPAESIDIGDVLIASGERRHVLNVEELDDGARIRLTVASGCHTLPRDRCVEIECVAPRPRARR